MITLTTLSALYPIQPKKSNPPGCTSCALTGWIPIEYFNIHELEIRTARKALGKKTRVVFRGPRDSFAQDTRREVATHAVIYGRTESYGVPGRL